MRSIHKRRYRQRFLRRDSLAGAVVTGLFDVYHILDKINDSGMGSIYRAEDSAGQRVAVKFSSGRNRTHEHEDRICLLAEARALAKISDTASRGKAHPNIVRILDFHDCSRPFFVMELLEGEDLCSLLEREKLLSWEDSRRMLLSVCSALQAAHAADILHGDVKPGNIFLCEGGQAKLLDFSFATFIGEAQPLRERGFIGGSYSYLAPEQFSGVYDIRTEVYALGVTMYKLLAGRLPFDITGLALREIRGLLISKQPPSLHEMAPCLPRAAGEIAMRAMAKKPEERFQTMAELRRSIEICSG